MTKKTYNEDYIDLLENRACPESYKVLKKIAVFKKAAPAQEANSFDLCLAAYIYTRLTRYLDIHEEESHGKMVDDQSEYEIAADVCMAMQVYLENPASIESQEGYRLALISLSKIIPGLF